MSDTITDIPSEALLDRIAEDIRRNRLLDGYVRSQEVALPLAKWPHGRARMLASSLCDGLGNMRLGRILDLLNWRQERDHDHYYFLALFFRLTLKSHYELIPEIEERLQAKAGTMTAKDRSNLLGFLAWAYALLRDFETAHGLLEQALTLMPDVSWLHVQKSNVLEIEDRYEEALESAKRAHELRPHYRPAVLQLCGVLIHLGRDDEAMSTLRASHEATQNASFVLQLMTQYSERDMPEECLRLLDTAESLLPLRETFYTEWLAGRRADFHYMLGDIDRFKELAAKANTGYHKKVLENLAACREENPRRVRLEVPFIRQHNMTCAPATLASLAKFWGKDIDHLEIAAAICYDGTPWHKERLWAESKGFVTREFRVTRGILHALIDRGLPFTLTTSNTTSAHLQACIGYDQRLDVILLRDPTHRHYGEMLISGLFEQHPLGPRGMVLVPVEKRHILDNLHFPEAAAFDALHDLAIALDDNDRVKAHAALALMRVVAIDSPLLANAQYRYHQHHGNLQGQWAALDSLLQKFPLHPPFVLQQMTVLQRMQRFDEQRKLAEQMIALQPHDPVFESEYGEILLADARDLNKAEHWLLRAMRIQRSQSHVYESLARCREKQRRFAEVERLRKIASCLSPSSEFYAMSYMDACRAVGHIEQGLTYLRSRVATYGPKDSGPWLTLAQAYNQLHRLAEARESIQQGLRQHPDDGDLLCRCGTLMLRWGAAEREEGINMIRRAREHMPEYQWLAEIAFAHSFCGQRLQAIEAWKNYLTLQPQSYKGHHSLATLLADEHGMEHAVDHLRNVCENHPQQSQLWSLLAEWQGYLSSPDVKKSLDHILSIDPDHSWALRERSQYFIQQQDLPAALADAREACEKTPYLAESQSMLATVLRKMGRIEEADQTLLHALTLSIDYTWAARVLVHESAGMEAQRDALAFIHGEMCRQVSEGHIVPEYQELAYPLLEPLVLCEQLRAFRDQRPDLWQTWSALKTQYQAMNRTEDALTCAREMAQAFPLLPRCWAELADTYHLLGKYHEECEAWHKALDLAPGWEKVARRLAETLELLRHYDRAEELLRRMINLEPLVAANHIALASLLAKRQRRDDALTTLRQCIQLIPMSREAWQDYTELARQAQLEEQVTADLRRMSEKQGHRADWWLINASVASLLDQQDKVIEHCRRGLNIQPHHHDLRDLLAFSLTEQKRYEEALTVCRETVGGTPMTREMEGRSCWVLLKSGKPVEAIEAMEQLLKREPDYIWIISLLANCYRARSQWIKLRDIAQHWLRMEPHQSSAYGYLAIAQLELNQPTQAKQSLKDSVKLDPSNTFACRQLFDMQLRDRNYDEARETLAHLKHYAPGSGTVCDEMDLLIHQKQVKEAMELIDTLLAQPDVQLSQLQWLRQRLIESREETLFHQWLSHSMAGNVPPHEITLILWVEFMQAKGQTKKCARQLQQLTLSDEARAAAWTSLIETTDKPDQIDVLEVLVQEHRDYFHTHSRIWNAVGYSYTNMGQFDRAKAWLKGWDQREDATDVTYNNVAIALDATMKLGAGNAARRKALARFPGSPLMPGMLTFLAFEEARQGRPGEAEALLSNIEENRLVDYHKTVLHLTRVMLHCPQRPQDAASEYRHAISRLASTAGPGERQLIQATEEFVLKHMPEFRNKASRLRSAWNHNLPHPEKSSRNVPIWVIILIIYILLKLISLRS